MTGPPLNDATFRLLRDLVYEKCGIYVPDTKKYFIENRLAKRVQETNLGTFEEYLRYLQVNGKGETDQLFRVVTTNETYFFREPQQFEAFTAHVVPGVLGRKPAPEIRIWSAACSTGEEPYTVAAILRESAPGVRADILGSDISDGVLESARKAVYSSYSVRIVPEAYLRKYFRFVDNAYELDSALKKAVRFQNINLVDEKKVRSVRNVDVIFCRNVLIYFDDKAKQKAVSLLYDALAPNGYLIVGTSETLHNVTRALKPVIINKVLLYQKV